MDWVKLASNYYNDPAVMRAGEAAEVLFTRALAYCGDHETDGFVPVEVIGRLTPTKATARAAALVRQGLWLKVDEGWRFAQWDKHQMTGEQLERSRAAARQRQAKKRGGHGVTSAVTHAGSHGEVTTTEVEVEVEAAAAAARDLPGPVAILRSKLDARRMVVRWDKLTTDHLQQVQDLVNVHGDGPLVTAAVATFRADNPPVFAQAWIGTWLALPAPGEHLRALDHPPCDLPGHAGTTNRCNQCASERLEAGAR